MLKYKICFCRKKHTVREKEGKNILEKTVRVLMIRSLAESCTAVVGCHGVLSMTVHTHTHTSTRNTYI